jgi:hypothetical protein
MSASVVEKFEMLAGLKLDWRQDWSLGIERRFAGC